MKIIHIIPSAFDYFDDIRVRAFSWVEAQNNLGFEVDVFMLQYNRPSATIKTEMEWVAPSSNFAGTTTVAKAIKKLTTTRQPDEPVIIHLHTPILGGAGAILDFVKSRPSAKLVITHHRPVQFVDLISIYIYFYNRFYLPKLFALAQAVLLVAPKGSVCHEVDRYAKSSKVFMIGLDKKSNKNYPHPMAPDAVAENLIMMYNNLIKGDLLINGE